MSTLCYKALYNSLCATAALAIALCALLPVTAVTANGLGYRGGQGLCPTGGCHDEDAHCGGNASCSAAPANVCLQGPNDTNGNRCGTDTHYCTDQQCNGAVTYCGGT
jgi:hypothetical protein